MTPSHRESSLYISESLLSPIENPVYISMNPSPLSFPDDIENLDRGFRILRPVTQDLDLVFMSTFLFLTGPK